MRIFSADDFDQVAIDSPFSAASEADPKLSFSALSEPALQSFSAATVTTYGNLASYNGHYYRLATSLGITRAAALAEAAASTFDGGAPVGYAINQIYQGYLVTITSTDEEAFIEGFIKSANGGNYFASEPGALWIGGEYWASAWRWATGPEAAQQMTYTRWLGSESTQGLSEPYAVMNMYAAYIGGNNWQSVSNDFTSGIRGYVIEYREITPPVVMTFSPVDGASNISISSNITLTFSEAIFKGTGFIEIHSGSENGPIVERFDVAASSALTFSGATLVIDPSVTLNNSTHYFVTIGSVAIQDAVGNMYLGGSAYDFSTAAAIITGTDGTDVLTGTSASEQIDGLGGNDTIYGLDGNDTITGGDGSDTIYGGSGDDVIAGHLFKLNTAVGNGSGQINGVNYYISMPDNIYGDSGNDTIYFSGGNAFGGIGDDTIYNKFPDKLIDIGFYQKEKSYIYGGGGNDTIISDILWSGITRFGNFESHYTISKILFGIEELKLISSSYIDGGDGNNIISGGFNDEIYTGSGNDYISAYDPKYIESGGGNDTIVIAHFDARNYYHVSGRNFNFPSVYESPLSAILDNTNFNTIVNAGAGDDRIEIGEFLFQVSKIDGGDGHDEVVFKNYFGVLNLTEYDEKFSNIEVFTSATSITEFNGRAIDDFLVGSDGGEIIRGFGGNDQIYGKGGNDYIEGNEGDDLLAGEDGNDTLLGGDGNDHLEGGAGNDSLYGGFGNDQIYSGSGNDIVYAGDGNDTVYGDVGDDQINGDAGDDFLRGNDGNDYLGGGDGNDILDGGAGNDGLAGGDGNDILYGAEGDDTLLGQGGDDLIYGGSGRDYIVGGDGVDKIFAGDGNDVIGGEVGNDEILGEAGDDWIYGDAGDDYLDGGDGNDGLFGGDGNDAMAAGLGNDQMVGGAGNDTMLGQDGDDILSGNEGDDYMVGGAGIDSLYGDAGNDVIDGGDGNDTITGGAGNDTVYGGAGNDYILGGDDNDILLGQAGDDGILGDAGNDTIDGGEGSDTLLGGDGNDTILGGSGNDGLEGGTGNDSLNGGEGNDTLVGGAGQDTLTGGTGADGFFFTVLTDSISAAPDKITDFSWADGDYINLSQIDANTSLAGDQAFSFVNSFTKQAGQATLSYDAASNTSTFSADVDGDGVADFVLQVIGQQDTSHGWVL